MLDNGGFRRGKWSNSMNEWGELKGEKVKNDVGVLMGGNEMRGSSYIQCEGFGGEVIGA